MPLVYGCIAPHGGEIIPALAGKDLKLFSPTRKGMRALARGMAQSRPDTIVIASPHNLRLLRHIGVVLSEFSSGRLEGGGKVVSLRAKCDLDLGMKVIVKAEAKGLPVVGANYGALEGPSSDLAMDWGTLVPLWFLLRGTRRKALIVTPSRGIPLGQNYEFGRVVAEAAEEGKARVAFVASADQAHAHRKDGPYGYSPRAKEYDRAAAEAVKSGRLDSTMAMKQSVVDGAKPDSLWQMAMLAGALSVVPMSATLVSYQLPTYYGMMCASFERRESARRGATS
jgi:aromatic ring-opening dioxygenase LigB subunit